MIDSKDIITVAGLVSELGVATATANGIVAELEPVIKVSRSYVYNRKDVLQAVADKNAKVLQFLGFPVNLSESYDANNVGV